MRAPGVGQYDARALAVLGWKVPETHTPPPASHRQALGLPPFGRGVELIASAIASTKWAAVRWNPQWGVSVKLADQPLCVLDPYPADTGWGYKFAAVRDMVLYGNHFAEFLDTDHRTARPAALVPIHPSQVGVLTHPEAGWAWVVDGEVRPVGSIFHVPAGAESGMVLGRGIVEQYAQALGATVAANDHVGAYFNGGGLPPAIIQTPNDIGEARAQQFKAKWRKLMETREAVVMPAGYKLEPVVSSAVEQQLVEARTWNATEIAMMLGIPSFKLGLAGPSMTYQNVETGDIDWAVSTLQRWADPLGAAFSKWLLPAGTDLAWDWASRTRPDAKTASEVVAAQVAAGVATLDEGRAMLGRPPLVSIESAGSTPAGVPELTTQELT